MEEMEEGDELMSESKEKQDRGPFAELGLEDEFEEGSEEEIGQGLEKVIGLGTEKEPESRYEEELKPRSKAENEPKLEENLGLGLDDKLAPVLVEKVKSKAKAVSKEPVKIVPVDASVNGSIIKSEPDSTVEHEPELPEDASPTKRSLRRKPRRKFYESLDSDTELQDEEDSSFPRVSKRYYSDDDYVPEEQRKSKRGKKEDYREDDEDDDEEGEELMDENTKKKRKRKKGDQKPTPKKSAASRKGRSKKTEHNNEDSKKNNTTNITKNVNVTTEPVTLDSDSDIENCLQSIRIQIDDTGKKKLFVTDSNDSSLNGTSKVKDKAKDTTALKNEPSSEMGQVFENFLANSELKIEKLSKTSTKSKSTLDIPVINPPEVIPPTHSSTQTDKVVIKSAEMQTSSPYAIKMKDCIALSTEQSENACELMKGVLKTTSELGKLMCDKSDEFVDKKINTVHIKDTIKMDYCIKKAFLLFKLAKDNLTTMEETLEKQYEEFLRTNELISAIETEKKIIPKVTEEGSDSDCEIVGTSVKEEPAKEKLNPKTVFLNKELSIKMAKKTTPTKPANDGQQQQVKVGGRHAVWINKSIMVKKVNSSQSFLVQDSRLKKPPDNYITEEAVSNFFDNYYKIKTCCEPYTTPQWLNVLHQKIICNYFAVNGPVQLPSNDNLGESSSEDNDFFEDSNVSEVNTQYDVVGPPDVKTLQHELQQSTEPMPLVTLCVQYLHKLLNKKPNGESNEATTKNPNNTTINKNISDCPKSLLSLCTKDLVNRLNVIKNSKSIKLKLYPITLRNGDCNKNENKQSSSITINDSVSKKLSKTCASDVENTSLKKLSSITFKTLCDFLKIPTSLSANNCKPILNKSKVFPNLVQTSLPTLRKLCYKKIVQILYEHQTVTTQCNNIRTEAVPIVTNNIYDADNGEKLKNIDIRNLDLYTPEITVFRGQTLKATCLDKINELMGLYATPDYNNLSESEDDMLAEQCEFPNNEVYDDTVITPQSNWASQIQLKELKYGILNAFNKQDHHINEDTPVFEGITLKLEPVDNEADFTEPAIRVKSEPEEIRNDAQSIKNFEYITKIEMFRNYETDYAIQDIDGLASTEQSNNPVVDGETFEDFVRRNKLMHGHIEYASAEDDNLPQKIARVRREYEPDSDTENDPMSLLIPQSFRSVGIQPPNKAKGTLLESSSEDDANKKTTEKKKKGRPRKSKIGEFQTNPKKLQENVAEKSKEKVTNEIDVMTRRMRDRIRRHQDKQKESSSDSETEVLYSFNPEVNPSIVDEIFPDKPPSVRNSSDSESDILYSLNVNDPSDIEGKTTEESIITKELERKNTKEIKKKQNEPLTVNVNVTSRALRNRNRSEKHADKQVEADDISKVSPAFSGFTAEDKNQMDIYVNNISTKIESLAEDMDETQILEPFVTIHEDGLNEIDVRDFDDNDFGEVGNVDTTKKDMKGKSKQKNIPVSNGNDRNVDTLPVDPNESLQSKTNEASVDLLNDPKLYQLCYVPMDKLPDSFVETYFQFMQIGGTRKDTEIDRLTNIKSLHRTMGNKEEGNKKKRVSKDAPKLPAPSDLSQPLSPDNLQELEPSDDDMDRTEVLMNLDPEHKEIKTENSIAKNSLMTAGGSDTESDQEDKPLSERKAQHKQKSKKKKVPEPVDPASLVLTADKMMEKELNLLHAPVIMKEDNLKERKHSPEKAAQKSNKPRRERNRHEDGSEDSSEEEKQWITTKEKLLKRLEQKRKVLLDMDEAKRTRIVKEYIEKKIEETPVMMHRRRGRRGVRTKKMSRKQKERQLRMLSMELKKELLNGQLGDMNNQPIYGKKGSAAANVFRGGRRNIRAVIDKKSLARSTVLANMEEFERKRRLALQQAQLSEFLGYDDSVKVLVINNEVCLEYDFNACQPVVSVHSAFTDVMKAHQCEGVKFMWDASFESLERIRAGHLGGGCILAHCMGLGKTLQVLALLHTVMTHRAVGVKRVLVCCPLSTVLNWVDEIHKWLGPVTKKIKVFELSKLKKTYERAYQLEDWYNGGGIFIIGYELFRTLTTLDPYIDDIRPTILKKITTALLDPGPDIVICDEGHLLKNDVSVLATAMRRVQTKRRIVLTGTPMQNNLREYYCMVNFVKPNLLGTYAEYSNRFENPIMNGQHRDSSDADIKLMKARTHILHKVLEGCLQRQEASVLYPYLPKKYEYTVFISLTKYQVDLYKHYLDNLAKQSKRVNNSILKDFHILQKIWTHPQVLHNFQTKARDAVLKEEVKIEDDLRKEDLAEEELKNVMMDHWWKQYLTEDHINELDTSNKFLVVFEILNECVRVNDKLLIFSTSLFTLDSLEYFLKRINRWSLGKEYYRLDGSVPPEVRQKWCREFNAENNIKTKLFLISTRAGCLGLNMTAANRVIILDTSWNPAHDIQSIFRVYRFGQKKDCYIYRLVSMGTMEQKIYERSVTKQAVACRVVDEQQIDRHYNMSELTELYSFDESGCDQIVPIIAPGIHDAVLLGVTRSQHAAVKAIHEHDSLLRDSCEQQLPEHERAEAWDQFQREQAQDDPLKPQNKRKKKGAAPQALVLPSIPPAPPIPTVPSVTITKDATGWTARRTSTSSTDSIPTLPEPAPDGDDSDDAPLEPPKPPEPQPSTSREDLTVIKKGKKLIKSKKSIPIQPEVNPKMSIPIEPIPIALNDDCVVVLSDDNDGEEPAKTQPMKKPKANLQVLSKQAINEKVPEENIVPPTKDGKVALHPSLLTNPYFLKIVAHTYRSWNPNLQEDAALSAAQFSANLLLKKGGPIVNGTLYEIAVKTLSIPTMEALWKNFDAIQTKSGKAGVLTSSAEPEDSLKKPGPHSVSKSAKSGPQSIKPGPQSIKPGPLSRKPGPVSRKPGPLSRKPGPMSKKPLRVISGPTPVPQAISAPEFSLPQMPATPQPQSQPVVTGIHRGPSGVVPVGLIRNTVDLSNDCEEEESILPDDDVPRISTASPPPLHFLTSMAAPVPTPPHLVDMDTPTLDLLEESRVQPKVTQRKGRKIKQDLPEPNNFDVITKIVNSGEKQPPKRFTIIRQKQNQGATKPVPTHVLNPWNDIVPIENTSKPKPNQPNTALTPSKIAEAINLDSDDDDEVLPIPTTSRTKTKILNQNLPNNIPTIVSMIGPNGQVISAHMSSSPVNQNNQRIQQAMINNIQPVITQSQPVQSQSQPLTVTQNMLNQQQITMVNQFGQPIVIQGQGQGQQIMIQTQQGQNQPIFLQMPGNIAKPQVIQAQTPQTININQFPGLQNLAQNQGGVVSINQMPELKQLLNLGNNVGNIILVPASSLRTSAAQPPSSIDPTAIDKPAPTAMDKPTPITLDKPAPTAIDKAPPTAIDEPAPTAIAKPAATAIDKPAARPRGRPRKINIGDKIKFTTDSTKIAPTKNAHEPSQIKEPTSIPEPTSVEEISSSVDLTDEIPPPIRSRSRSSSSSSCSSSSSSSRPSSPENTLDILKNVVHIHANDHDHRPQMSTQKLEKVITPSGHVLNKISTSKKSAIQPKTSQKQTTASKSSNETVDLTKVKFIPNKSPAAWSKPKSYQPSPKPGPLILKSSPSTSSPRSSVSNPGSLSSKPGPSISKLGPSSSKPGTSISKPGLSTSKPGLSTSKPGPSLSKPGPSTSKPGPMISKPGISTSKPVPSTSSKPPPSGVSKALIPSTSKVQAKKTGPERILGTVDLTDEPVLKRPMAKPSQPVKTSQPEVVTGGNAKTIFINSGGGVTVTQGAKNIMLSKSGAVSLTKPAASSPSSEKAKVINITSINSMSPKSSIESLKRKAPPEAVTPAIKKPKSEKSKPMCLEDFTIDDMLDDIVELE